MNRELKSRVRIFMPSPYDEGHYFGVDAAVFSKDPFLWNMWKYVIYSWQSGVKLHPKLWELTEEILRDSPFVKFRYNLFLQYKRPDYITRPRASMQYKQWKRPFLRYDIDEGQQDLLFKLERNTTGHAFVLYACASFRKWIDPSKNSFIQNSNYVQPNVLQGHYQYTFVERGKNGCAFSQPTFTEGVDLLKRLEQMKDIKHFENNLEFLRFSVKSIKDVIYSLDEESQRRFQTIQNSSQFPDNEFGSNIITMLNFNLFANTSWGIGYETNTKELSEGKMRSFVSDL